MNDLHKRGERILIRWPGGPYDFIVEFEYSERVLAAGWEDWIVVHGFVVEPQGPQHQMTRSFYCHPFVNGDGSYDGYEMIPYRP